jgi:hypothetical protein
MLWNSPYEISCCIILHNTDESDGDSIAYVQRHQHGRLSVNGSDLLSLSQVFESSANESAILEFFATTDVNPKLERVFATVDVKYVMRPNDDAHTVDLTLRLERKH